MMDKVHGEQTKAIDGDFTPTEAIDRMLAGTALVAREDEVTGGFVISLRAPKGSHAENGSDGNRMTDPSNTPTPQNSNDMNFPKHNRVSNLCCMAHNVVCFNTLCACQCTSGSCPGRKHARCFERASYSGRAGCSESAGSSERGSSHAVPIRSRSHQQLRRL